MAAVNLRPCRNQALHERHTYRWWLLARTCPGRTLENCGRVDYHARHWHGPHKAWWCRLKGLAGECEHGRQMLVDCPDCEQAPIVKHGDD